MRVEVRANASVVVAEPAGDIDGKSAPDFQEKVLGLVHEDARILLDLSRVPFVSSAGLRALLLIHREAKASGAKLVLVGVNRDVRASMSATGFLGFFTLCESAQEGRQLLG